MKNKKLLKTLIQEQKRKEVESMIIDELGDDINNLSLKFFETFKLDIEESHESMNPEFLLRDIILETIVEVLC